jgi:hypothetical protein
MFFECYAMLCWSMLEYVLGVLCAVFEHVAACVAHAMRYIGACCSMFCPRYVVRCSRVQHVLSMLCTMLQRASVCFAYVVQCYAVCCSMFCIRCAPFCSMLQQLLRMLCNMLRYVVVCCSMLCTMLQHLFRMLYVVCYSMLQYVPAGHSRLWKYVTVCCVHVMHYAMLRYGVACCYMLCIMLPYVATRSAHAMHYVATCCSMFSACYAPCRSMFCSLLSYVTHVMRFVAVCCSMLSLIVHYFSIYSAAFNFLKI